MKNIILEQNYNTEIFRTIDIDCVNYFTNSLSTKALLSTIGVSDRYLENSLPEMTLITTFTEPSITGDLASIYLFEVARVDKNIIDLDHFIHIDYLDTQNSYHKISRQVLHASGANNDRYSAEVLIRKSGSNDNVLSIEGKQRLSYISNLIVSKELKKYIFKKYQFSPYL